MVRVGVALVYSGVDAASRNIARHVRELVGEWVEVDLGGSKAFYSPEIGAALVGVEGELVYADQVEDIVEADLMVFLSRHAAAARLPSLTVHVPGNWTGEARLGGEPEKLCVAPATPMLATLRFMCEHKSDYGLDDWLCSYEATHHGPYIRSTPVFFAEIGSTEEEWVNERAGELVAMAVVEGLKERGGEAFLGIGGPHYAPKLTRYALEKGAPIGHIAPKYVLGVVKPEVLVKAVERTMERVKGVIIDWKGTKRSQRDRLLPKLLDLGLVLVRA